MQGAKSAQKLDGLPDGLQGYAINFEEFTTWVVVSSDNDSHILDLSEYDFFTYDVFNKELENQEGKLEITLRVSIGVIPLILTGYLLHFPPGDFLPYPIHIHFFKLLVCSRESICSHS